MKRPYIVGIYLAAGSSRRFGSNKLSTLWNNKPLGQYGLDVAIHSKLDHVIVVGREESAMDWLPRSSAAWELIYCKNTSFGQAYSIRCGLLQAMEKSADAIIILLADQPFLTTEIIDKIINTYLQQSTKRTIYFVAASCNQMIQPPVLFHANLFNHLLHLTGDSGAKSLIQAYEQQGVILDFDKKESFMDIDTKEDWYQMEQRQNKNDMY
ncbi:nucleotidyltransferase family protein [Ornithinibacillus gellani]|uniref:nucleotidyltransferase family protein n=1 Tax=Ornithinibacillus gellani TaxID=2293253 RepID=UPI001680C23E|nr:nucleotidyltransferase family protein [Ornithinibacillus gellani]